MTYEERGQLGQSVVFLGYRTGETLKFAGTAFFVAVPISRLYASPYLVTTAHTIKEITTRTTDAVVYVRANRKDMSGVELKQLPLKAWRFHEDDRVDVAAVPVSHDIFRDCDVRALDADYTVRTRDPNEHWAFQWLSPGTEIQMIGLFTEHYGKYLNVPIVRAGIIASCPPDPVKTRVGMAHAYLADIVSIGGHSGSPVFTHDADTADLFYSGTDNRSPILVYDENTFLVGLMQGHWREASDPTMLNEDAPFEATQDVEWDTDRERRHTGISIIIPSDRILETLNQREFVEMRETEKQRLELDARHPPHVPVTDLPPA
jgi:hypothetical protein